MRHDVRHPCPSGLLWATSVGYGVHCRSAPIACVPVRARSSTRIISLLLESLMATSLFLACSIRTSRNDSVRLDTEMTNRSTEGPAAYCQHNLNPVCAEAPHLQVAGDVIPITASILIQKHVELQAPPLRRCHARARSIVAHVHPITHFSSIDVVTVSTM